MYTMGCLLAVAFAGIWSGVPAQPTIFLGPEASAIEQGASTDLQRLLYVATGTFYPIETVENVPEHAKGIVVGTPLSLPKAGQDWPFGLEEPEADGYILYSDTDTNGLVFVAGQTPTAAQNGVYGLLEALGFGFYTSQETLPDAFSDIPALRLPRFNASVTPVFKVRGTLPFYDYLMGHSSWEIPDYKAYIDALARMRMNTVTFYVRDDQPFAAYEFDGLLTGGEPLAGMARGKWRTDPVPTEEFYAGTGRFFARDTFGAANALVEEQRPAITEGKAVLREAIAYARSRGLDVGLGIEVHGDILHLSVSERFEARLRSILADYPDLTSLWLWQPEGQALYPGEEPAPRSAWASYAQRWDPVFGDSMDARQRAEAVRIALFALHGRQVLDALRPDIRLVMSGWGGDEWLRCTDFYPALNALLPAGVVLSALDNPWSSSSVSSVYDQLASERACWPVIWHEFAGDLWMPQPNLYDTAGACRDARSKGCEGLIGAHWRTRSVEEAMGFAARFAWDPTLTPEAFVEARAKHLFGDKLGATFAPALMQLQELGYRYVGGTGQTEGGPFAWSVGDEDKRAQLAQIALEVRDALGEDRAFFREVIKEVTGLVSLPEAAREMVPSLAFSMSDAVKGILLGTPIRPDRAARLQAELSQITAVLAYDHAAEVLGPGGEFSKSLNEQDLEAALAALHESKFSEALYAHGRGMTTKGQLGELASMNGRAWADIRARLELPPEKIVELTQTPADITLEPRILVLPDRVIVLGLDLADATVRVRARPLGTSRWVKRELYPLGVQSFALAFPKQAAVWPSFEWGVEVTSRSRTLLAAPDTFPNLTFSSLNMAGDPPDEAPAPAEREIVPVAVTLEVKPEAGCVHLTWNARPGELYRIRRDDMLLGITPDGWYEDTAPRSGHEARYSVTARDLLTGQTAEQIVHVVLPDFSLPEPPQNITIATRNSRIVLGWEATSALAAAYRISRYDENDNAVDAVDVASAPGHFLQYADKVSAGEIYTYEITGVTPDGRLGPPSRRIGVIAAQSPVEPMVSLSFEDNTFLAGLAQIAENALALGGSGWAELPPQPEWNPAEQLSLSLWVRMDDLEGMPVLLCKGAWQRSGYFLQIFRGQLRFYIAGVGTLDAGYPKAGEWQHLAATYGFGEMQVYVNGELAGRKRVAGRPRPSANPLLVGRYALSEDVYFVRGMLDDIAIHNVCLAPEEIRALYDDSKHD
jgi:hypothetical protein